MRNKTITTCCVITILLAFHSGISAQVNKEIGPGQLVRVTYAETSSSNYADIGTFESSDSNSIKIRSKQFNSLRAIPLKSVRKFELSQGQKSFGAVKGAGIGFLVGAGIGVLYAFTSHSGETPLNAAPGAGIIILSFTTIGGILGAVIKYENWKELPLEYIKAEISGHHREQNFMLSLSFRVH